MEDVMAKQFAPDPSIGIWKLNVHKSNFVLVPAPKGSVMKVEAWQDGMKMSADTIDADGNKMHQEIACKFDGKDYPLTGSAIADSISTTRISARKSESVWKKQGKVVVTAKTVISSDGKTLTVMRIGRDSQGRMAGEVLVYERQ
jgi:hypothetical protein